MKKLSLILISVSCLILACNEKVDSTDTNNDPNTVTKECSDSNPCTLPYVCSNDGMCVLPLMTCSDTKPCTEKNMVCSNQGVCVQMPSDGTEKECSLTKPCADPNQTCTIEGKCITQTTSEDENCSNCTGPDKICVKSVCLNTSTQTCYGDIDCPSGFVCDNKKCVDSRSCSMTRTCAGDLICDGGLCVAKPAAECDKKTPCQDSSKTCVAGHCVSCHCQANEICLVDGTCAAKGVSSTQNIKDDDPCTWNKDFAFCENNQMFNCISSNGNPSKVESNNCGGNICTTTSEEGIGCHEPCTVEGAFYGECVNLYSADNTVIAFTQVCERTADGSLVWTFTAGYQECEVGCTNGRCVFTPSEFGESCTASSYPDACQGDWMTYCYSQGAGMGSIKTGTYCPGLSKDHFCSLPSESALALNSSILGYCNLSCQVEGKIHSECEKTSDGTFYSAKYICAKDTNDKLSDFQIEQIACGAGCNASTGECN